MPAANPVNDALAAADVPRPARDRVKRYVAIYKSMAGEPITDAVISEFPSGELGRVHEAIWLFSRSHASESSLVNAEEDDLDFVPMADGVKHVITRSRNYDWDTATDKSRVRVELWFADERYGEIKASGANCDRLRDVLRRTVLPEIEGRG